MPEKSQENVYRLGFVSLFTDLSSQMIYPLIPAFLESLGATKFLIGVIEGVAEGTASFVRMIAGAFSDRLRKRRLFVFLGYSLSTLVKPFLFLAHHWLVVFVVRFLDRVGKGIRTPARDALIADSVDPCRKGLGFGFHRGMDRLGAALGPLLAMLVLSLTQGNVRMVFLLSVVPAAVAVGIIGKVREIAPLREAAERLSEDRKALGRGFSLFIVSVVLFTLGNSSNAFLILKATEVGLSVSGVPLIWLTYNLVSSASSPVFGGLSDRVGRKPVILLSFLVYGAIYAGFGFSSTLPAVWLLFACYGLHYGLSEGIFRVYIADLVESHKRATAYGLFNTAVGITLVPSSIIFGALWDSFSSKAAFLVSAGLAILAAVVFLATQMGKGRSAS
ncbi:MAG: MFS transporter [Candidatus Eiseniibacteriota bacterium]|nr:MAG: MFS transporter [Candidatus Eisenbacteria bacterium]